MNDYVPPSQPEPPPGLLQDGETLHEVLRNLDRQARAERLLESQRASLMKIMEEWDDLLDWVQHFDRKYLPKDLLLKKLLELRPF